MARQWTAPPPIPLPPPPPRPTAYQTHLGQKYGLSTRNSCHIDRALGRPFPKSSCSSIPSSSSMLPPWSFSYKDLRRPRQNQAGVTRGSRASPRRRGSLAHHELPIPKDACPVPHDQEARSYPSAPAKSRSDSVAPRESPRLQRCHSSTPIFLLTASRYQELADNLVLRDYKRTSA